MENAKENIGIQVTSSAEFADYEYGKIQDIDIVCAIIAPSVLDLPYEIARPPIDLITLIDTSGSMQGNLIKEVGQSLAFVAQQLNDKDRLSLISFSSTATLQFPLMAMSKSNKSQAEGLIHSLCSNPTQIFGSTNLSDALQLAISQSKNATNLTAVLIFTDGYANKGIKDIPSMLHSISSLNHPIFAFGLGNHHDPHMLKSLADKTGGMYYYISKLRDIPQYFADCLGLLTSVCVDNLTVTFQGNESELVSVSTSYASSQLENGKIQVDLKNLLFGERRHVVCKVRVPSLINPISASTCLAATVRYDTLNCKDISKTFVFKVSRTLEEGKALTVPVPHPSSQKTRLSSISLVKHILSTAEKGDFETASTELQAHIKNVPASALLLKTDLKEFFNLMKPKDFFVTSNKEILWKLQAHERERSIGEKTYETNVKSNFKWKLLAQFGAMETEFSNVITLKKRIRIGNEHKLMKGSNDDNGFPMGIRSTGHKWKVYVRGEDLESVVENIVFELHPTFQPSRITLKSPPYEVERTGYGYFTVGIKIYFKPEIRKKPCFFEHELDFGVDDKFKEREI